MSLIVRKMKFELDDDMDMLFVKDDPESSCYLNAISLMLPYLEPYIIRAFKQALPLVSNNDLRNNMELFIKQEAQHFQQHQRYNEVVRKHYPGVEKYEVRIKEDFDSFLEHKDIKFNIGYVEGFEALTTGMSIISLDGGMCSRAEGTAGDLFRWHFCEEVEHRTIAYDVYHDLYDEYWHRAKMTTFALKHMAVFIKNVMGIMLKQESIRINAEYNGSAGRIKRLTRFMRKEFWLYSKATLRPFNPKYSPYKLDVPQHIFDMADAYAEEAIDIIKIPLNP